MTLSTRQFRRWSANTNKNARINGYGHFRFAQLKRLAAAPFQDDK